MSTHPLAAGAGSAAPTGHKLALALGAASVGGATDPPPEPVDSAILFAPAGELVPSALAALDRGGTLALAQADAALADLAAGRVHGAAVLIP